MAILKLYNDEKVIELLNDDADMENPLDSWSFDGNNGLSTDRTLFLLITENRKTFWRSIHIRYNMMNDKFYIDNISHEEYFEIATQGMTYDTTTGDALSTINPKGRYLTLTDPTSTHAVPLYNNKFNCLVKDIKIKDIPDKDLIEKYSAQWDYFMESAPMMKNDYIKLYGNKETYIASMTEPLFYNAFVSNETGWLEQGDENQVQWILTFRERFINNLPKNTKLRVYNFTK